MDHTTTDWRAVPRKVVDFPITLLAGRSRMEARLVDVSTTGIRMATRTSKYIGEHYQFEVRHHAEVAVFRFLSRWDYWLEDHFVTGGELEWDDPREQESWLTWMERMPECDELSSRERGFELRAAPRLPTTRPVLFRDRHTWVKGSFRNISEGGGGALLVVQAKNPPMPVIHFRIRIDEDIYNFRAQTAWTRLVNGEYHLGCKFIEPIKAADGPLPQSEASERPPTEETPQP